MACCFETTILCTVARICKTVSGDKLRAKIYKKMLRKKIIGGRKRQIDTVKNYFRSHKQGEVEDNIEDMIADPNHSLELVGGGHRENIHIPAGRKDEAIEYVANAEGVKVPWGFNTDEDG